MNIKGAFDLLIRYVLLVVIALPNLFVIYFIFTPPTVYVSLWVLHKIYGPVVTLLDTPIGPLISLPNGFSITLISACIAGAAYYLLFVLNLTTPMPLWKRGVSLLFISFSFLALNIVRIILSSILIVNDSFYFKLTHEMSWYFGSTVLVVLIWFANVFLFKINAIPIFTDVTRLAHEIIGTPHKKDRRGKHHKQTHTEGVKVNFFGNWN